MAFSLFFFVFFFQRTPPTQWWFSLWFSLYDHQTKGRPSKKRSARRPRACSPTGSAGRPWCPGPRAQRSPQRSSRAASWRREEDEKFPSGFHFGTGLDPPCSCFSTKRLGKETIPGILNPNPIDFQSKAKPESCIPIGEPRGPEQRRGPGLQEGAALHRGGPGPELPHRLPRHDADQGQVTKLTGEKTIPKAGWRLACFFSSSLFAHFFLWGGVRVPLLK